MELYFYRPISLHSVQMIKFAFGFIFTFTLTFIFMYVYKMREVLNAEFFSKGHCCIEVPA